MLDPVLEDCGIIISWVCFGTYVSWPRSLVLMVRFVGGNLVGGPVAAREARHLAES